MNYIGKVLHGDKTGREIGFPTINLDPHIIPSSYNQGVYAAKVWHDGFMYKGALFYGPRLVKKETQLVLEIFIVDFSKEIYDEEIRFEIGPFVRKVLPFDSLDEMKKQIQMDIQEVKKYE